MAESDHLLRMIAEIAEQRRANGRDKRKGKVVKVWAQNGEQKVQIKLGSHVDGSNFLSPWLHTSHQRGSHREEHKFYEGQNVVLDCVGGDLRQAIVSPDAETQNMQRPNHANDLGYTEQYDTLRETHYPDAHEHWLAQKSQTQQSQAQQTTLADNSSNSRMQPEPGDDSQQALTLIRHGARPQQTSQANGQPWKGPPPTGGQPKPRVLAWSKGSRGGNAPPDVNNELHLQYADNTKGIFNDGMISHAVSGGGTNSGSNSLFSARIKNLFRRLLGASAENIQSALPGDGGVGDGSDASSTTIMADKIVHRIGNSTALTMLKNNITAVVGGGAGGMLMPEMLPGILGPIQAVISQMLVPMDVPPQTIANMASAAYASAVGQVGSGANITPTSIDLQSEVSSVISSQVGSVLTLDQAGSLTTAIVNKLNSVLGSSYAVGPTSANDIAADLLPIITSQVDSSLDSDQAASLANSVAANVVNQAVISTLPINLTAGLETSPENMTTLRSAMSGQMGSANSLLSPTQLAQIAQSVANQVAGLSGGSVWSMMPNSLSHHTQQNMTHKSAQNIGHTAGTAYQATVGAARIFAQNDKVVASLPGQDAHMVVHQQGVKIKHTGNSIFVDQAGCWSTVPINIKADIIPDGTAPLG